VNAVADLAIIIVSIPNAPEWLRDCLPTVFRKAGNLELDVVVACNEPDDGARELVEREFPQARAIMVENRGFAHANNRALMTCDARYVLFLNPDTQILEGTFEELVEALEARPTVGLVGVKQLSPDGTLFPTIRRTPNALRALGESLASEKLPFRASWLGERELDLARYEQEVAIDWTTGSFMLARREAIESAGFMDERTFLYSEEADLCLRMQKAGWEIRHLPLMTILHHADKAGVNPRMAAQAAAARKHFAHKHFSFPHRYAYLAALSLRYLLRYPFGADRRSEARRALRVLSGLDEPPFGPPPRQAVRPRPPAAKGLISS
jgi:hypothetical protein